MVPTYTVTPTGPHSLKFTTLSDGSGSSVVNNNHLRQSHMSAYNVSSLNANTGCVMKTSVAVQTATNSEPTETNEETNGQNFNGSETNLLKARECCLDIAL